MNVTDFQEIWQIDVGDQVYEATFEVLTQWINEGSLMPQDRVRRGNLRWIEARRVPSLAPFFNARESGTPLQVVTSTASGAVASIPNVSQPENFVPVDSPTPIGPPDDPYRTTVNEAVPMQEHAAPPSAAFIGFGAPDTASTQSAFPPVPTNFAAPPAHFSQSTHAPDAFPAERAGVAYPETCSMHPDSPAFFVCDTCANVFCKLCPKSYGGTVRICPFCGAMCQRIDQKTAKAEIAGSYRAAITGGFGFGDFANAFVYPFQFKFSLIVGALMFMVVTLGQSASAVGGFFMMSASLMCYMLGNMLYFGILTNVLENFSQGFTDRNFMPSFDDFSIWDDVVHPFFLSIAVYLVSFGLFLAIIVGSVVYIAKSAASARSEMQTMSAPVPSDPEKEFADNPYSKGDVAEQDKMRRAINEGGDNEEEQFRKLQDLAKQQRKEMLESGIGKTPETVEKERSEMASRILKMALPVLLLSGIALLWGIFYLPAACLVAGYTRSFKATLNPKIGLETIKILGADYAKILGMGLLIGLISIVVGVFLGLIFAPFNMPAVGNLPANAIGALFSFYLSVVFSITLGYALFKNSDKLQLFRG
jgi:hypothetical protein